MRNSVRALRTSRKSFFSSSLPKVSETFGKAGCEVSQPPFLKVVAPPSSLVLQKMAAEDVETTEELNGDNVRPVKSVNDNREFLYFPLENGIRCVVMSDPQGDLAAAR